MTDLPFPIAVRPALYEHNVDVWAWHLDVDGTELGRLARLLSSDERARISRYAFAEDQMRFTVARTGLRRILALYTGVDADTVAFAYGEHGKPSLSHRPSPPFFNLSHSGGLAVAAITRCGEVGVDVEEIRPIGPEVASQFLRTASRRIWRCSADRLG